MRRMLTILAVVAVAGCTDQSMTRQPRYGPNAPAPAFENGSAAQPPPAGTIAQEDAARNQVETAPPVNMTLLQRGKERFETFARPATATTETATGPLCGADFRIPLLITARR